MAVDAVQLVTDDLEIAIALDSTLGAAIPRQVEAQIALQGWEGLPLTSQQKVYIAKLATKGLLPRVISKLSRLVQEVKGGPAEAKFNDAIEGMKLLQNELKDAVKMAAKEVAPEDVPDPVMSKPWPDSGPMSF